MNTNNSLPEIVKRAMVDTITSIGQLSKSDINTLNSYVKKGWLSKGKGGPFPMPKTVYACAGFNFEASRKAHLNEIACLISLDNAALAHYSR